MGNIIYQNSTDKTFLYGSSTLRYRLSYQCAKQIKLTTKTNNRDAVHAQNRFKSPFCTSEHGRNKSTVFNNFRFIGAISDSTYSISKYFFITPYIRVWIKMTYKTIYFPFLFHLCPHLLVLLNINLFSLQSQKDGLQLQKLTQHHLLHQRGKILQHKRLAAPLIQLIID